MAKAAIEWLERAGIRKDRIVFFSADGASTNMGEYNGAIAHLREHVNALIQKNHCALHRLALAMNGGTRNKSWVTWAEENRSDNTWTSGRMAFPCSLPKRCPRVGFPATTRGSPC